MSEMVTLKKRLAKKWSSVAGPLNVKSIEDRDLRENLSVLLENQERGFAGSGMVTESDSAYNAVSTVDLAAQNPNWRFQPIALALVRRTFPELFANKCVGVQAMNGPVGLAFALRFTYNKDGSGAEAGWDKVPEYSGYTGNQNGTSAALSAAYGGLDATGIPVSTGVGEGWSMFNQYGNGQIPQIGLRLDRTSIEAGTRKLGSSYALEAAQDIKATQGLDVEREMIQYLQYEITAELDRELITRMKMASVNTAMTGVDPTSGKGGVAAGGAIIPAINVATSAFNPGGWGGMGEKFMGIVAAITAQSNNLLITTRRGAGNFVIVSPDIATALQGAGHQFIQFTSKVNNANMAAPIGKLNGTIDVYRDQYARSSYALVGFKGAGISDAGIIFCPYTMGLTMRSVDPYNFAPNVGVMSRYGIVDSLLGAGRYYRLLNFTNVDTLIPGAGVGLYI